MLLCLKNLGGISFIMFAITYTQLPALIQDALYTPVICQSLLPDKPLLPTAVLPPLLWLDRITDIKCNLITWKNCPPMAWQAVRTLSAAEDHGEGYTSRGPAPLHTETPVSPASVGAHIMDSKPPLAPYTGIYSGKSRSNAIKEDTFFCFYKTCSWFVINFSWFCT